MSRTILGTTLMCLALAAPAAAQQGALTSPSASTEGRASVKVAPDVAWLTVTAESRALRTADAQRDNAATVDALKASLKRAGFGDDVVKTRSYSVEPQMQYTDGKSKVIGYIARHSLEVRIDDVTKIGTAIDAAGGSGATSIGDVRYDVKDRASIETKLLGDAVRDGMRRAEAMAAGAGKEVMTIWRIDEQRFSAAPQPMFRMAASVAGGMPAPATDVAPNEIEIQAQVAITVILK